MSARGFTLVELLVASVVLLAVCGALAAMAGPARVAFDRSFGVADASTRSRTGLETLLAELRQAGAGADAGPIVPALADLIPVVVPARSLDDLSKTAPYEAIALAGVPRRAAQGVLRNRASAGAVSVRVGGPGPCAGRDASCGFESGTTAALFDAARLESVTIASASGSGTVSLSAPLMASFEPGAAIVAVESAIYGLRTDNDGTRRLVRRTAGGAEQPIVDHVVEFDVRLFGTSQPAEPGGDVDAPPSYGPVPPAVDVDDGRDAWPAGETCTMTLDAEGRRVPRMATLATSGALALITGSLLSDGPWCPDAGAPAAFDADLLRIRRVDIRLRVEAASASLRGPAGRLFRRPGSATRGGGWVPDVELHLSVMLRNR